MKVSVLNEAGYDEAMLGLSLSYSQPVENMEDVARKLIGEGGSHTKFLESIVVWLDVTAPRYFYQQLSTYRVGISVQSASTMHTLLARPVTQDDFCVPIPLGIINTINLRIRSKQLGAVKGLLPEGFLQRRIVCLNYKCLSNIYGQRIKHKLPEWQVFLGAVLEGIEHPEFITGIKEVHNEE